MTPHDDADFAVLVKDVARHEHDMNDEKGKVPRIEARLESSEDTLRKKLIMAAAGGAMGGAILANLGSGALSDLFKLLMKSFVG